MAKRARSKAKHLPVQVTGTADFLKHKTALAKGRVLFTLLAGTALGAGLAFLAPTARVAMAADHNECGPMPGAGPTTINCTGTGFFPGSPSGNVNGGIEYNPSAAQGPFTLNFGNAGGTTTGVLSNNVAGGFPVVFEPGNGIMVGYSSTTIGPITTVLPAPVAAQVTINTFVGSGIVAQADGMHIATDGSGNNIIINAKGDITAGQFGILASTGASGNPTGAGNITITQDGHIQSTNAGIIAWSSNAGGDTPDVKVTNNGSIQSTGGAGIIVGNPGLIGNTPIGLLASTLTASSGTAEVTNNSTIRAAGNGIWTNTTGNVTIDNSLNGTINAGNNGIAVNGSLLGVPVPSGGFATVSNEGSVTATNNGIFVFNTGGGNITNNSTGVIHAGANGIQVGATIAGVSVPSGGDFTITNNGALGTTGTPIGGNGIQAFATGNLTIANGAATAGVPGSGEIHATGNGIVFGAPQAGIPLPTLGTATVQNDGLIQAGGRGIWGLAVGDVGVTNSSTGVINSTSDGINVTSLVGNTTVTNAGNIAATAGDGIDATSLVGNTTVLHSGNITSGGAGILAVAALGNVTVDGVAGTYGTVNATNGPGILAIAGGNVSVDAGQVTSGASTVLGFSGGVIGVGGGDTVVNLHGSITANGGLLGAAAISATGAATVNTNGQTIDPAVIGSAAVVLAGTSDATVNGNGSTITGTSVGALALNLGAGNSVVNANGSIVTGTGVVGIASAALGGGNSTVNASDANSVTTVTGGFFGIASVAVGGGNSTVNAGDGVSNFSTVNQTGSALGIGILGVGANSTVNSSVVNAAGSGIVSVATGGDSLVNTWGVTSADGLFGVSSTASGNSTVNIHANVGGLLTPAPGVGVFSLALGGNSNVAIDNGLSVSGLATGVTSTGVNSTVTAGSALGASTVNQLTGALGVGILSISTAGNSTVDSGIVNAAGSGVVSVAVGGDSLVNTWGMTSADGLFGVSSTATGNSTVNIHASVGGLTTTGPGIGVFSVAGGNSSVTVDSGLTVNGQLLGVGSIGANSAVTTTGSTVNSNGVGIFSLATGGNSTVDAGVVNSFGSGVVSTAIGGDSNVNLHGNVSIASLGNPGIFGAVSTSFGGNATVTSDQGVVVDPPIGMASITFGPGTATVNNNGLVNSTVIGLLGVNIGSGAVVINNNGTGDVEASTGAGVSVVKLGPNGTPGSFDAVVNNAGIINAPNGPGVTVFAIDPTLTAANNVQINNTGPGASIVGAGGFFTSSINVVASPLLGGNVEINNTGGALIDNQFGINNNTFNGLSVNVLAGGNIAINNSGVGSTINGNVLALSTGAVASDVTFNNTNGALWHTEGFNVMTALNGNVTINNTTGAAIRVGTGPTGTSPTFAAFLMGAPNGVATVNNSSNQAQSNADCNTLAGICVNGLAVFSGIGGTPLTFNNAGGLVSMINGVSDRGIFVTPVYNTGLGDVTVVNGDWVGGNQGATRSQLGVDAFLAGPNNSSADLLRITGTANNGQTGIIVANGNNPGAYNPVGIPVVQVTSGQSTLANWYIDPQSNHYSGAFGGVIDKGLFFYTLQQKNDPNVAGGVDEVLVSAPNHDLFELNKVATAAQNIWYETTGTYLERQADLRDQIFNCGLGGGADMYVKAPKPVACPGVVPGVWLKAVGSWTDRRTSDSFALPVNGRGFTFDTSYKQSIVGVMAGADTGWGNLIYAGDTFLIGALGGYLSSNVDFNQSATTFNFTGGTAGAYATYLNGRFFLDAVFKADMLDMKWGTPDLAQFGFGGTTLGVNSYGMTYDTGYRMAFAPHYFWEPLATFSWVHTTIDSTSVLGTGIAFQDSESLRGSLGGRIGADTFWGNTKLEGSLIGRVWDEFGNPGNVVVNSAGNVLTNADSFKGTFGEVSGLVNMFFTGTGWSGFAEGGVKWNSDFTTVTAQGGLRYHW